MSAPHTQETEGCRQHNGRMGLSRNSPELGESSGIASEAASCHRLATTSAAASGECPVTALATTGGKEVWGSGMEPLKMSC